MHFTSLNDSYLYYSIIIHYMNKSFSICIHFLVSCVLCLASILSFYQNLTYRSSLQYPRILSNIWGYTDTVNHKEYALVGEETGLSIVDVTDPDNPNELFFVANDTSTWQEPKTWSHYAPEHPPTSCGQCWPAGHASGGFALVSVASLALTRRRQLAGVAVGLTVGGIMGVYQMLKGAHYTSDTLVTMLIAWLIHLLLRRILVRPQSEGPT